MRAQHGLHASPLAVTNSIDELWRRRMISQRLDESRLLFGGNLASEFAMLLEWTGTNF